MLRQLIGQLQDLVELYGSHPRPNPTFLQFQLNHSESIAHFQLQSNRCCFPNVDDGSSNNYYDIVMAAGKPESVKMLEGINHQPNKKSRKEQNRGKLNGILTREVMEEQIWEKFPQDLIEAVVARLPIATFFHFRSVCKKWNSLLDSQSFLRHCEEVQQTNPWFYTITHEDVNFGVVYDPTSKKWHHFTKSLPTNLIILPVASAGGLVCSVSVGNQIFCVCNPLTQSFRELPARSFKMWSRFAVGMSLNGKSTNRGYKILWVACNGEYEIYDSLRNSWTHPGSMPSSIKLPINLNDRSHAVSIDDTVYFMQSDPEGILSYNMVTGVWKQFAVPAPNDLSHSTLAEYRGQLILVGLVTKNSATCIFIWELQKMTLLWKEVDRMPNIWCLDFYGKYVHMTCLGNKDLLMLSLRSRQMNRLITYNFLSREWLKVPGCVVPSGRRRNWIAWGAAFYPCLAAKV